MIRIQDKGSRFVLIDEKEYEEKMFGPTPKHLALVESWCSKWLGKGEISPKVVKWGLNKEARPGVAFGSIKTHKMGYPLRLITFYLHPLPRKWGSVLLNMLSTALAN